MKILFCDDTPETTLHYCDALKLAGHEVVLATSPNHALQQYEKSDFDTVVLDADSPPSTLNEKLQQHWSNLGSPIRFGFLAFGTFLQEAGKPFVFLTAVPDVIDAHKASFPEITVLDKLSCTTKKLVETVEEACNAP